MTLAWVASYPRSGNTWTRIMLANYLRDEQVRFRVAELDVLDGAVTSLTGMFEQGRMIPLDLPYPVSVKTHFLPGAEVHTPYREAIAKVVYLVRNPRDVMHSAERFLRVGAEHRTAFAEHFIAHRGVEYWRQNGFGTWPESVREWTSPERIRQFFPNAELQVLRYEDLKQDATGSLTELVGFLGLDDPDDPDRIPRAVRHAQLETLRDAERNEGSSGPAKSAFFGAGLSGQSLADHGEQVEESYRRLLRTDEEFAELAHHYGYGE